MPIKRQARKWGFTISRVRVVHSDQVSTRAPNPRFNMHHTTQCTNSRNSLTQAGQVWQPEGSELELQPESVRMHHVHQILSVSHVRLRGPPLQSRRCSG